MLRRSACQLAAAAAASTAVSTSNKKRAASSSNNTSKQQQQQTSTQRTRRSASSSSTKSVSTLMQTLHHRHAAVYAQPFSWLLMSTIERGCTVDGVRVLVAHPDAPPPADVLVQLSQHCVPSSAAVGVLLQSALEYTPKTSHVEDVVAAEAESDAAAAAKSGSDDATASSTTTTTTKPRKAAQQNELRNAQHQRNLQLLQLWELVLALGDGKLYSTEPQLIERFCSYFLLCGLAPQVSAAMRRLPTSYIDRSLWQAMLRATALGRVKDYELLWRLVRLPSFYLQALLQHGGAADESLFHFAKLTEGDNAAAAAAVASSAALLLESGSGSKHATSSNSTSLKIQAAADSSSSSSSNTDFFYFSPSWPVSADLCAHILSSAGAGGQMPLLCATHLMLRYLETETAAGIATTTTNKKKSSTSTSSDDKNAKMMHPVPFLAYLTCIVQQRVGGRHPIHWLVPWRLFQRLNASNPGWLQRYPSEAETICRHMVEVLASAAPPGMAFAVARIASGRGAVDGVDIALHLLNRFNVALRGATPEVQRIVSRIFGWLVNTVEIQKRPARHAAVVLTARVLIRFGMTEELSALYSKVLDQASEMQTATRESLLLVMHDLVCPKCCSILSTFNVHEERLCDNCLETVPAKPVGQRSSFELTQDYLERVRQKRKERMKASKKSLRESVQKIGQEQQQQLAASQQQQQQQRLAASSSHPPMDPAELLKLHVSSPLVSGVPARSTHGDTFIALLPESLDANDVAATSSLRREQTNVSEMLASRAYAPQLVVPTGVGSMKQRQREQNQHLKKGAVEIMEAEAAAGGGGGTSTDSSSAAAAVPAVVNPTPWVCLWCHELNQPSAESRTCCTCGADTGPAAPWRVTSQKQQQQQQTQQQDDDSSSSSPASSRKRSRPFDPKLEIKAKVSRAIATRSVDDIVSAAYYCMLYRRAFLLRAEAGRGDFVLIQALVELLCSIQEKTLAAYVFAKVLPAGIRLGSVGLIGQVAALFVTQGAAAFPDIKSEIAESKKAEVEAQEQQQQQDTASSAAAAAVHGLSDKRFFELLFGPSTCEHCFGVHPSNECSIVTRRFASTPETDQQQQHQQQRRAAPLGRRRGGSVAGGAASSAAAGSARTSPEEKLRISIADITQLIDAMPATPSEPQVVAAYHRFVLSPNRELFAGSHHAQANLLAFHLCRVGFPKRAAFVLCHVPLESRTNESLTQLAGWFDLSPEDIETLLSNREIGDPRGRHPNVIQLTRYCCVCFDGQHASHNCPRMREWFADAFGKDPAVMFSSSPSASASGPSSSAAASAEQQAEERQQQYTRVSPLKNSSHRCVQVNGWTTSGPERLHALYRFLLAHIEEVATAASASASSASSAFSPPHHHQKFGPEVAHALNTTIARLVATNQKSPAWRLFARSPPALLHRDTIRKVLLMNGVEDMLVDEMLGAPTVGADVLQLAVPPSACLICFDSSHSFQLCPELRARHNAADAALHVLGHVARLRSDPARGVAAAASYVQHAYTTGQLTQETLHRHATLPFAVAQLAQRCFQLQMPARGYQLLRRLPFSAVTPSLVIAFWRGAGVPQRQIDEELEPKLAHVLKEAASAVAERDSVAKKLFGGGEDSSSASAESNKNNKNKKQQQHQKQQKQSPEQQHQDLTKKLDASRRRLAEISKAYHQFIEGPVCRHCCTAGHAIIKCDLFFEESSFGRDLLSIFRVLISHTEFKPDETRRIVIHLAQYLLHYHRHLPYHVIGVSRAMNSVAALLAMMHLPGAALRLLLSIPAGYRARHVYHHILQAFDVSPQEKDRRSHAYLAHVQDAGDIITMPDSLMQVWPPQQDVAMSHVFAGVPGVAAALAAADKLLSEEPNDVVSPRTGKVVLGSCYDPRRPPQAVDVTELREALDPTQRYVEDRIGLQIGSRHVIFSRLVELFEDTPEGKSKPH